MPARNPIAAVFDRTGALHRPSVRGLWREVVSNLTYFPPSPVRTGLADGRGQVVLVIPAFMTNDMVTRHLRKFLHACGYRSFGWGLGLNWGPTPRLTRGLRRRFAELRALSGDRVSLIGLSLGGVLARDLAYDFPDDVRQVITLASPFNLPTASVVEPMVRLTACFYRPVLDIIRLATPLPVPSAAIFTREDGVVAWESCCGVDPTCTNVEVEATHLSICRNPEVLRTVARQLESVAGEPQRQHQDRARRHP
jgi:pimeloyl-ACP methyl ester carboxylesterase